MQFALNENLENGSLNHNIRQVSEFTPASAEVVDRLRDVTVDRALLQEITSHRYLLFPYTGASVRGVTDAQIDTENDDQKRQFCTVASAYHDTLFYNGEHNPAWVAMLLEDESSLDDSIQEQLKATHVLMASLLASQNPERPLRSLVENPARKHKQVIEEGKFTDDLGVTHSLPHTESRTVTQWGNQYWKTADSFLPREPADKIIVGDTQQSGTVLSRMRTYAGYTPRMARGIVIPS